MFKPVGTATHYHADWVVPYWHAALLKIAEVHTHIFYRWPGKWGSPAALAGQAQPPEILPASVMSLAGMAMTPTSVQLGGQEATTGPPPIEELSISGVPAATLRGSIVRLADAASETYALQLPSTADPGAYALIGLAVCGGKPLCLMMGWTSLQAMPSSLPVPSASIRTVAFIYRKLPGNPAPQLSWDCPSYPRRNPAECIGAEASQLRAPLP